MRFHSNPLRPGAFLLAMAIVLMMVSLPAQRALAQGQTSSDRGWNALADVLDVLTPSVNTENPPSGEEINRSIQQQIDHRQAEAALKAIEAREAALADNPAPGTDVQLMFQKARALAELGRSAEAEAVYRDMTVRFPELPEPWNNLAILYISRNDLDQARMALEAAIMNNPRYTAAISNLADLRLLLSLRDYEKAAALGDRKARLRAQALREFLIEVNQP